ncbi:MAG: hypothetical protein NVSMB31_05380 [Vulcanimicrobiaceae bacterium]
MRILLVALLLMLCTAAVPEPAATLTPPADWIAVPAPPSHGETVMVGSWVLPGPGHNQNIVLFQEPSHGMTLKKNVESLETTFSKIGTLIESHEEKTCDGKLTGWIMAAQYSLGKTDSIVERMLVESGEMFYEAMYVRTADKTENIAARNALRTLCVR